MPKQNKSIPKKSKKKKKKFEVQYGLSAFSIIGRSPFGSGATKIKVNQNKSKGHVEDRRHILHYDEVLKPTIERVMTKLLISMNGDMAKVALLVSKGLQGRGIKRLPKNSDKLMVRMVTEINSARENLIPDRADTNKAIEVVRGYLRKYITQISTSEFAEDCMTDNHSRMGQYKKLAKETFLRDSNGGDITEERNRIHGDILEFINGCQAPGGLWSILHDLVHSATFDFSPKITRDFTVKAIEWQKTMMLNEDSDPQTQLKDLLSLI